MENFFSLRLLFCFISTRHRTVSLIGSHLTLQWLAVDLYHNTSRQSRRWLLEHKPQMSWITRIRGWKSPRDRTEKKTLETKLANRTDPKRVSDWQANSFKPSFVAAFFLDRLFLCFFLFIAPWKVSPRRKNIETITKRCTERDWKWRETFDAACERTSRFSFMLCDEVIQLRGEHLTSIKSWKREMRSDASESVKVRSKGRLVGSLTRLVGGGKGNLRKNVEHDVQRLWGK
jgi:hypothetical protein